MSKVINSIWNEFKYGGHLLSVGAACIVYAAAIILKINVYFEFLFVIYLGMQLTYSYNRYKELDSDIQTNPERSNYIIKYSKFIPIIISVEALLIIYILISSHKDSVILFSLALVLFGLSYTFVFKYLTRYILGFKNIFVSISWTLLLAFLVIYSSAKFSIAFLIFSAFIFMRVLLHEILSDFKDINSDRKNNLLTIAVTKTKRDSLRVISTINIISILPIIIGVIYGLLPKYSLALILLIPYSFFCIDKIQNNNFNKDMLYTVVIDNEFILYPILIILAKSLFL